MGLQQLCAQQVEHVETKLAQERVRSSFRRTKTYALYLNNRKGVSCSESRMFN